MSNSRPSVFTLVMLFIAANLISSPVQTASGAQIGPLDSGGMEMDAISALEDCFTLTITVNPPSAGSVIAGAPNCGSSYTFRTVVSLTAQPNSVYTFGSWSGDASGTSSATTVTMLANRAVTANFNSKAPTLTSIIPTNTTAGSSSFTLTLTGTNFVPDSVVRWNGSALATTYGSASSLTASVPEENIATGGSVTITVDNPPPGGGTSAGQTFTINNPAPTLSSINPTSTTAGGSGFTLTLTGANFNTSSVARWNGVALPTTVNSATSLTATVPEANISAGGTAAVTIDNPAPGGGTSLAQDFTINNPAPLLGSINPASAAVGGNTFNLTLSGSGFVSASKVRWNGTDLTTTYVSATLLTASVPASNIASTGSALVIVYTPAPGGGISNELSFTISNPVPVVTTITPGLIPVNTTGVVITIQGMGFVNGTIAQWNGENLVTTYVDANTLTARVPDNEFASPGSAFITVWNPAPGGGASGEVEVKIVVYRIFLVHIVK